MVLVGLLVLLVTVTGRAAGVAVQGTIVDPAGSVIPGATVELLSGARVAAKVVSAADGTFRFADVAAGTYDIRVTLAGFRQTQTTITVGTTAPPPLQLKLLIGSVSETVRVEIETTGTFTYGMTVIDWRGQYGRPPNTEVLLEVDAARLVETFTERLTAPRPARP